MATRGTANHVYFTDEILGAGSTAIVYVGRNKKSGQLCAVKVYSAWSSDQMREFQTMKMLDHENIIKFISVETESISKGNVLVMELSNGGSVLGMLERPDFAHGFPEDEFLLFLRDTTSALKYLREKRVVHRDIKPGNILKFIKEDMSSQYKITDFGAARELKEEEDKFYSIYGTEEYLEPTAYQQALLGKGGGRGAQRPFSASVDLWSLGVTLYHVVTGQLPFQAFGGRKNKEEMFNITSGKPTGAISGVQLAADGQIEWSDDLPDTCLLSRGLKKRLQYILARLLESDPKHRWTFEDFFRDSIDLTSSKVVRALVVHEFLVTRFYVPPREAGRSTGIRDFLEREAILCSTLPVKFYHPIVPIDEFFESLASCQEDESSSFFSTELLFLHPQQLDPSQTWKHPFRTCPKLPASSSSRRSSVSDDLSHCRKCLAYVSLLERKGEEIVRLRILLDGLFHSLWRDLTEETSRNEESRQAPERKKNGFLGDDLHLTLSKMRTAMQEDSASWSTTRKRSEGESLAECKGGFASRLCVAGKKLTARERNRFAKVKMDLAEFEAKFRRQAADHRKDVSVMTHNEIQIHKFNAKKVEKLTSGAESLYLSITSDLDAFCKIYQEWLGVYLEKKRAVSSRDLRQIDSTEAFINAIGTRKKFMLTWKSRGQDAIRCKDLPYSDPLCYHPRLRGNHLEIQSRVHSEDTDMERLKNEILKNLDHGKAHRDTLTHLIDDYKKNNDDSKKHWATDNPILGS